MTASGEAPIQNTAPAPAIRVLHLAQSDGGGGANKAAFRLHRSLRDVGVASTFHPGRKIGNDPDVIPAWPPITGNFISTLAAWLDSIRSISILIAAAMYFHRSVSVPDARDVGSLQRRMSSAYIG